MESGPSKSRPTEVPEAKTGPASRSGLGPKMLARVPKDDPAMEETSVENGLANGFEEEHAKNVVMSEPNRQKHKANSKQEVPFHREDFRVMMW